MTLQDLPALPTAQLRAIAEFYDALAKQYHAKQLIDECLSVAKLCRDEIARRI